MRKTGDLVEVIDGVEAAEALAVGQQPGRLRNREVLCPQLLEGDGVEVDLAAGGCRRSRGRGRRERLARKGR
jgi:hypothetical protein